MAAPQDAERAFDHFLTLYRPKYPKAVECLEISHVGCNVRLPGDQGVPSYARSPTVDVVYATSLILAPVAPAVAICSSLM